MIALETELSFPLTRKTFYSKKVKKKTNRITSIKTKTPKVFRVFTLFHCKFVFKIFSQ